MLRTRPLFGLTQLLALGFLLASCGSGAAITNFPTAPLLDPNTATEAELSAVPGLSEALVSAIVSGRPYATPSDLHAVVSVSTSEAEQHTIYGLLFVQVGLNSGAEEDYKLVPSTMSPRKLAHEFEEYRPYKSMDQFKREMAKYVSDAKVAYLSRYVTLQ